MAVEGITVRWGITFLPHRRGAKVETPVTCRTAKVDHDHCHPIELCQGPACDGCRLIFFPGGAGRPQPAPSRPY
jgi:hypothetical protein